jgi:hypothetical protein
MTTITQTVDKLEQSTRLERAVERAERYHIIVKGQGRRRSDNARLWLTNSHSGSGLHIVALEPGSHRLHCDCQSRVVCSHRATVHVHLVHEAATRAAFALRMDAALLADDSKPVSMWR